MYYSVLPAKNAYFTVNSLSHPTPFSICYPHPIPLPWWCRWYRYHSTRRVRYCGHRCPPTPVPYCTAPQPQGCSLQYKQQPEMTVTCNKLKNQFIYVETKHIWNIFNDCFDIKQPWGWGVPTTIQTAETCKKLQFNFAWVFFLEFIYLMSFGERN